MLRPTGLFDAPELRGRGWAEAHALDASGEYGVPPPGANAPGALPLDGLAVGAGAAWETVATSAGPAPSANGAPRQTRGRADTGRLGLD